MYTSALSLEAVVKVFTRNSKRYGLLTIKRGVDFTTVFAEYLEVISIRA